MIDLPLPPSPIPTLTVIELKAGTEPLLQRLFEENPLYFLSMNGQPAGPTEAHEEIHDPLPAGWTYTRKLVLGYIASDGSLAAMANIVSDMLAPTVWHISTFIVATARHGSGDAATIYQSLEVWASKHGAKWLRLGVVRGNPRAEHFWDRQGFTEARVRYGVQMGVQTNALRVMFKPLTGGTLEQYIALVARDRPDAA